MDIKQIYPVFIVSDISKTKKFYTNHFGFQIALELDWFLNLNHPSNSNHRIVFVQKDHSSVPDFYKGRTNGFALDFRVEDATAEFEKSLESGIEIKQQLRDEPFGDRHFIVTDPDGVLINVVQSIEMTEDFSG
ncbi:MAG: VOC family protein [Pyrinomonadaceae bacterium]